MTETKLLEQKLKSLRDARKFREKYFGIEGYIPNRMQYKAHRSKCRTILYIGGNRAGKSTFGAAELCFHITGNYPDWFPVERRIPGPIKAAISATEFPIVTRVIEPKVFSLLPRDFYKFKRTAQGYLSRITCINGSTVDVLTSEMKDEAYELADWDFVWCDEPQSQYKYQAIRRGLVDRMGQCCITFTPLTEPWMKEQLVDKADGKSIDVYTVNIRDNLEDMHGTPILSEEAIAEFEANLPDEVKESRIHGKFFHLRGVVYKSFSDANILDNMEYSNRDPVIAVLDPHDRNPHHVIWAYIDSESDINVDYELIVHCELKDLAKKILSIEKGRGYNVRKRIIDPNFGRKPAKPGVHTSVMQELANNKCSFYDGNDDVELGHMTTRSYIHYDTTKDLTAVNKPKLFFSRAECPETIRSMRNLQYEEWKGNTKNERDPKEVQKPKEDHGADCVRYLCITKPKYEALKTRRRSEDPTEAYY